MRAVYTTACARAHGGLSMERAGSTAIYPACASVPVVCSVGCGDPPGSLRAVARNAVGCHMETGLLRFSRGSSPRDRYVQCAQHRSFCCTKGGSHERRVHDRVEVELARGRRRRLGVRDGRGDVHGQLLHVALAARRQRQRRAARREVRRRRSARDACGRRRWRETGEGASGSRATEQKRNHRARRRRSVGASARARRTRHPRHAGARARAPPRRLISSSSSESP